MKIIVILFYLLLILVGVSFAVLNATPVQVNFYITHISIPISVLVTMVFGVGVLVGYLLFLAKYWRLKMEAHKLRNQLKLTEKEIKNLRAIPLKDQH